MNPVDIIMTALGFVSAIPAVGPIVAKVAAYSVVVGGIATALVGAWHSLIALCKGLGAIPGFTPLDKLGDKLKVYDGQAEGIMNQYALPLLNRLSLLAPPKAPAPPAA